MTCPKCGHEQKCPCASCQPRHQAEKPWVHVGEYAVACGECGYTLSYDQWMDIEYAQYKALKGEA